MTARTLLATFALTLVLSPALLANEECPYGKLKWADFKGAPPAGSPHDAETSSGAGMGDMGFDVKQPTPGNYEATLTDIKTSSTFSKRESWVTPGTETPALLEHEQYHLDISEYWARQLDKLLRAVVGKGTTAQAAADDASAKADDAYDACLKDCDALQKAYDKATDHSMDAVKQAEWCKKIGDLLNPPKPLKDVGEGDGGVDSSADGQDIESGGDIDSFHCEGTPFFDPALFGAHVQLPVLSWSGYFMDSMNPQLIPAEGIDDTFSVTTLGGDVALSGHLRLLMGDETGTTFTGWIEGASLDPVLLGASPFLQLVQQTLAEGDALVTLQLTLPVPLELATNGFTMPANLPANFSIGSAVDPFQHWLDFGHALAGVQGEPNLFGLGDLLPGNEVVLIASNAAPNTGTFLVLGLSLLQVPFKGGVFVPSADEILGPLPLDADGLLVLSFPWPAFPPGVPIYVQAWTPDAAAVKNFSATNGVGMVGG